MSASIEWVTLEFVDGSSNKFYRAFLVTEQSGSAPTGVVSLLQWGSQKTGRNGGQFKVDDSTAFHRKVQEKTSSGYTEVDRGTGSMPTADWNRLINTGSGRPDQQALGQYLDAIANSAGSNKTNWECNSCGDQFKSAAGLQAHVANQHPAVAPVPLVVKTDVVSALADDAKELLGMAVTDPNAAQVKLVSIREQRRQIQNSLERLDSYMETVEILVEESLLKAGS